MTCEKYNNLTPIEKVCFIGQLTHAAMCDEKIFDIANDLIALAVRKGLFNSVTILPNDVSTEIPASTL